MGSVYSDFRFMIECSLRMSKKHMVYFCTCIQAGSVLVKCSFFTLLNNGTMIALLQIKGYILLDKSTNESIMTFIVNSKKSRNRNIYGMCGRKIIVYHLCFLFL